MWRTVSIKRFRGFEELELADLGRINLIAGRNNVGKTNLLEALFLHGGAGNPELALRLNVFRGLVAGGFIQTEARRLPQDLLGTLFYQTQTNEPFEVTTTDRRGLRATTRFMLVPQPVISSQTLPVAVPPPAPQLYIELATVEYQTQAPDGKAESDKFKLVAFANTQTGQLVFQTSWPLKPAPVPVVFLPMYLRNPAEDANRLADLIREGQERKVVEALKVIEPRVQGLLPLPMLGGSPLIFARLDEGSLLPLAVAGEGMERLARILLAAAGARDGVMLVDEVEAGFHHLVLKKLWEVLARATADYNVQLFATTHSWEAIVAAHEAFSELEEYEEFRYIRLDREDGRVRATVYSREALEAAIEGGLEVR